MKDITTKAMQLENEFSALRRNLKALIFSLTACDSNTNLTKEIGQYARKMPKFTILVNQQDRLVSLVGKVCTGEILPERAVQLCIEEKGKLDKQFEDMKQNLSKEINDALTFVCALIDALDECNATTNLTNKIGRYARKMPEFKILSEQRIKCLSLIRQVCTGEMSPENASQLLVESVGQLHAANDYLNKL